MGRKTIPVMRLTRDKKCNAPVELVGTLDRLWNYEKASSDFTDHRLRKSVSSCDSRKFSGRTVHD